MAPGLDNTQSRGGEELPCIHQSSEVVVAASFEKETCKQRGELNRESQNVLSILIVILGYSRDVLL